jgi:hypothetical protein
MKARALGLRWRPRSLNAYDEAGHLIGEYNAKGKLLEETVYLDDMSVAVIKPTGVYFVHSDYRKRIGVN